MRKLAFLVAFSSMAFASSAGAQPQVAVETRFLDAHLFRNYSFSAGVNGLGVEYQGVGDASQTTGLVCAETDIWDTALRYAGEFGGFRLAAAAGVCHGFGDVREPVGGFTGHAQLNSMFTIQVRGYPLGFLPRPTTGFALQPYVTGGFAYAHFKVAAVPFESFSGFLPGAFVGVGVESSPVVLFGPASPRDIQQAAMRVYLEYRHYEFSGDVLSGGLPFDLDMDTVMLGVRIFTPPPPPPPS